MEVQEPLHLQMDLLDALDCWAGAGGPLRLKDLGLSLPVPKVSFR